MIVCVCSTTLEHIQGNRG